MHTCHSKLCLNLLHNLAYSLTPICVRFSDYRLKVLLEQQQRSQLSAGMGTPRTTREARIKLSALNDTIVKLSHKLEQETKEKEHLKAQLERYLGENPKPGAKDGGGPHGEKGIRGAIADRYKDCRREEMLSAIVDLELVS